MREVLSVRVGEWSVTWGHSKGGKRMDRDISFDIQIIADSDDTEPPEIFSVRVTPVRTAIVLTPQINITICGGMNILV